MTHGIIAAASSAGGLGLHQKKAANFKQIAFKLSLKSFKGLIVNLPRAADNNSLRGGGGGNKGMSRRARVLGRVTLSQSSVEETKEIPLLSKELPTTCFPRFLISLIEISEEPRTILEQNINNYPNTCLR